jgi:hypothetical protein
MVVVDSMHLHVVDLSVREVVFAQDYRLEVFPLELKSLILVPIDLELLILVVFDAVDIHTGEVSGNRGW